MSDDDIEDLQVTYPGAGTFKFGDSAKLSRCGRAPSSPA